MAKTSFYSNGKLLITGEYVVLDGALSLALPTKYGQSLDVFSNDSEYIRWKSIDNSGTIWFENTFHISTLGKLETNEYDDTSKRLFKILNVAKQLNPRFLISGFDLESKLSFPLNWGLGSSSTLINNIASWAQVDPYKLLKATFGGSGYDIACAKSDKSLTYQLKGSERLVQPVLFNPNFKDCLYFVYLNKKQNSRDGISHYKNNSVVTSDTISTISNITSQIIDSKSLSEFESLLNKHEDLISSLIKHVTIKESIFPDYSGSIKSLGAWGGDFVLVTAKENPSAYFKAKGFETIISYQDLIL